MHASSSSRLPVSSVVLGALSTFSIGWLAYYATQDTIRRVTIRSRRKRHPVRTRTSGLLPHKQGSTSASMGSLESGDTDGSAWYGGAQATEVESIKRRYAPLRILRRYVNPFPEWRETGVWEFLYYKTIHSILETPHRIAWDGGLAADLATEKGKERVKELLPVQKLDRDTLWGKDSEQPCADSESLSYTWIGQSTCLIQMNGINILTDPVFGLQPIESIFSPVRMAPMPCTIEELTGKKGRIDVVLISHK
jgi:N-acyl-phosphatidylethanolamine-hydrolysing phospholipase D